ncbi:MAG: metallophosphoesterase [Bacteroidales bacterium]|nr:metallophosphoesterase [Bacteroidales bacterium]MCF8392107.1 metallophosphoesterase [Bacteroidales bacterium]
MKIAIISDIHEDIISLEDAFRKIEKQKCDEIICLGDISGYSVPYYKYIKSRNAHKCLSLIRSHCKTVVLGNHDLFAGKILPENSSFFNFPKNWYQMSYQERQSLSENILWLHEENDLDPLYTDDDIEYLRTLKEYSVREASGINIHFSHYVHPNLSGIKKGFFTDYEEFKGHLKVIKDLGCQISFTGHSHVRGCYTVSKGKFTQFRYKSIKLSESDPVCVGIPPITSHKKRNGFCIFDLDDYTIQIHKM